MGVATRDEDPPPPDELTIGKRRYRLIPLEDPAAPRANAEAASLLTGREVQVAVLVAEGLVNKQIALRLGISEWTVATHLRRIFTKLGVDTRAAMVCRCVDVISERKR
jgi:DNA-binding NarL/FixJ family response regulator